MGRTAIPDISVIIPAYNAMPYFTRCLESVVGQSLGTDRMEVIVIDDGSTDGTGDEADRYALAHPGVFQVVHADGSGGPAKPRNTGLDLASGRYVFFLDADDYLGQEALERLLNAAEKNDSDIVLGRMRSDTTRGVPESMFQETDLDADLFTSRVYWTLAALKLFRRELLEDNAIRFPEHFPNCSDQPFTATAYLRSRKTSILSDYDYYFAVLRDDGNHVTRSGPTSNRLDVVEAMCDLLLREVPDPDNRAPLLTRHFQIDLRRVIKGIVKSPRPQQEELLARVATLVRTHLSPEVLRSLRPDLRVVYNLAGRERLDETLAAAAFDFEATPHDITVEGDRVYAHLPFFRDPEAGVPDECYDVTDRTKVDLALASCSWTEGTLRLTGRAGLRRVASTKDDTVEVIVRRHGETDEDLVVRADRLADDGFAGSLDLLSLADGKPLSPGVWDVYVRITRDGLTRTARLGSHRSRTALPSPSLHYVAHGGQMWTATTYATKNGKLSLDVGQRKFKIRRSIHDWAFSWSGTDLVVRASLDLDIDAPLALALVGEDRVLTFPLETTSGGLSGRVPVTEVPPGRWAVRVRVGAPPTPEGFAVPATPGAEAVKWRDPLLPSYARPVASDRGHLFLEVARIDVLRGAVRATRRLVRRGGD